MIKKFATLSISTFVVLAISLGLIELVMRLFDPMGIIYFNEASKYFSNMVDNPNFGYIHRSNHKGNYQGVAIHTNELGLRWHPLESTSHEATVLLLGDSVVFGWGVEQEYIVASRFEKILAEKEMNIRVISAGVGSWNTRTEYEYLKFLSDTTEINYVILLIVSNDIRPKTKGVTSVSRHLLQEEEASARQKYFGKKTWWSWRIAHYSKYSMLLQTMLWILNKENKSASMLELYKNRGPSWRDAREALISLIRLCEKKGINLIPYIFSRPDSPYHQELLSLYAPVFEDSGMTLFTIDPQVHDHRNSIVDGHPDARGHQLMAEQMAGDFVNRYSRIQGIGQQ